MICASVDFRILSSGGSKPAKSPSCWRHSLARASARLGIDPGGLLPSGIQIISPACPDFGLVTNVRSCGATSVSIFAAASLGHACSDWCRSFWRIRGRHGHGSWPLWFSCSVIHMCVSHALTSASSARRGERAPAFSRSSARRMPSNGLAPGRFGACHASLIFQLRGTNEEGVYWTHIAEAYPLGLCRRLARMAHNATLALQAERLDPIFCPVRR